MKEKTLAMLKPDGVKRNLLKEIENRIISSGLKITHKKDFTMSKELAHKFRAEIRQNHPTIFEALVEYMTEGPSTALVLEGENAIQKLRAICGPTNPNQAPPGTIRGDFGDKNSDMEQLYNQGKVVRNLIHSSGNAAEASRELELIFGSGLKEDTNETN